MIPLRDINPLMSQFMAEYASEECTDERRVELERLMESLEMERADRLDSLQDWRDAILADAEFLSGEIARLESRKKASKNLADRIKLFQTYLLSGDKLKTKLHTFYYMRGKRVVADLAKLPEEFIRRYDPEPKKDELKKALNAGQKIDGAFLEDGEQALCVR